MLVSNYRLVRKTMEYSGPADFNSYAEIRIEIAGLRHLIKEAEAKISAHEQVLLIAREEEIARQQREEQSYGEGQEGAGAEDSQTIEKSSKEAPTGPPLVREV